MANIAESVYNRLCGYLVMWLQQVMWFTTGYVVYYRLCDLQQVMWLSGYRLSGYVEICLKLALK